MPTKFRHRVSRVHINAKNIQSLSANATFSEYFHSRFFPIIDVWIIVSHFFRFVKSFFDFLLNPPCLGVKADKLGFICQLNKGCDTFISCADKKRTKETADGSAPQNPLRRPHFKMRTGSMRNLTLTPLRQKSVATAALLIWVAAVLFVLKWKTMCKENMH